jgi:hypothetical protein
MAAHRQFVARVPASCNPILRQDVLPARVSVGKQSTTNPPGPRPFCDQQDSASPPWPPARSVSPHCQRGAERISGPPEQKTKIRRQSFALPLETCKPWRKLPPPCTRIIDLASIFSLKQGVQMVESDALMQAPIMP